MNNRKRVGDRTEPYGIPLLICLGEEEGPYTTAAIDWLERKLEIKVLQIEGYKPYEGSLESKDSCQTVNSFRDV